MRLEMLMAVVVAMSAVVARAEGSDVLKTLRKEHPRVMLTAARLEEIQANIKSDETYRRAFDALIKRAEKQLGESAVKYELVGPRLLYVSRRCLDEVTTCALAYRLTAEKKYAERAIADMLAAAGFPEWHPAHFLDTAEMTCAMGIGYDWLFDVMTDAQRKTVRDAIVKHGLKPGELAYGGKEQFSWWTKVTHNWSQVCNGGLTVGALAIADEEPELAGKIVREGLANVKAAYASWDADGGWAEGPGYWAYTTQYTCYHLAALQSALGTTAGLEKGLENAGMFRVHFVGPTGKVFNFADAWVNAGAAPQMFFLSRRDDRPLYAWHHRQEGLGTAWDLLWMDERGKGPKESGVATDAVFRGVNVVFLRSAWEDPRATWVGIKGGDNAANHSHLDLGSFVLEANGQRWVEELGADDYNLPNYFGSKRWTYYRLRTEGQNTLLIDGTNQPAKAKAGVIAFSKEAARAVIDLSEAYPMAKRVWRGVERRGKSVVMVDEIDSDKPVDVEWRVHTLAKAAGSGTREVVLTQGEESLRLRLLEPQGAVIEAGPAEPPEGTYKTPLAGITVLKVKAARMKNGRIVVGFLPGEEKAIDVPPALSAWVK